MHRNYNETIAVLTDPKAGYNRLRAFARVKEAGLHVLNLVRDRGMIGRVIRRDAARHLLMSGIAVPRYDAAIRQLHYDRRIIGAAIEVNQKARPGPQQGRRAIGRRQGTGHRSSPDVVGDMGGKQRRIEPQCAETGWQGAGRMIAQQQ